MKNARPLSGLMRRLGAMALFCLAALTGPASAGVVPGLQGEYFNNMTLAGAPALTRIDATVDFDWGTGSPGAGLNADQFSVRWTGFVRAPANGNYLFQTRSDDGVRLWVNGVLIINNWTDHSPTDNTSAAVALVAGTDYPVIMEFYENGGGAEARLRWRRPADAAFSPIPTSDGTQGLLTTDNTAPTIISVTASCGLADRVAVVFSEAVDPATATAIGNYSLNRGASVTGATLAPDGRTVLLQTSVLSSSGNYQLRVDNVRDLAVPPNTIAANTRVNFSYPGGGLRSGLSATYYDQGGVSGAFFTGSTVSRVDGVVDFDWGGGSPAAGIGADNFSVRWTGYVQAPVSGVYAFRTQSDDGIRLWVGGAQVINNWTDHGPTYDTGAVTLAAGQYYAVTLEYYERGGGAVARLQWQKPGDAGFSTLPAGNLFHCDSTPPDIEAVQTTCGVNNRINVVFTEPVDPATATVAGNYQLNNGASVSGAAMAGDGRTVSLLTSVLATGLSYQLRVRNVLDTAVPPNEVANPTIANFTLAAGTLLPGLSGTYFSQGGISGAFFTGSTVSRVDGVVDFDWGGGSPAAGIGADNFSVRWTGYVQAPVSGVYAFRTQSDDGIRLWVGGAQVINNWTDHGPTYDTGAVTLAAGQYYAVTLEYYERGGGAVARLQWQKPGDAGFATLPAGNLFHCGTAAVAPGGFNAFETSTPAGNITGVIRTKVAAQAFDLAVVVLNVARTGVETGFEGDVKVELLDTSDNSGALDANGCRSSWTPLPPVAFVPQTLPFMAADQGRKNITLTANNVWRDARVRMSYPATGVPSATGCSTDNFAIRPASFAGFVVQHADWENPGLIDMNNLSLALRVNAPPDPPPINLTNAHKAGRPFRVSATAVDALIATATNYAGLPTAVLTSCVGTPECAALGADCACTPTAGTLSITGSALGGVYATAAATYDNIGAFAARLQDTTFASVDLADTPNDCSGSGAYVCSSQLNVGRFVPDHFTLTSSALLPACGAGPGAFTYMNQGFPSLSATIEARSYGTESITTNYHSPDFGTTQIASVDWKAENADNGIDLSSRLSVPQPPQIWVNGVYSLSTAGAQFRRAIPDNPDGPYDQLQLGVAVTDPDDVLLSALDMNPLAAGVCISPTCTARSVGASTSVRFGRLRLLNAHGSELRALPLTVRSEYWSGSGFALNSSDSCTTLAAANFGLSNWQRNLNPGETALAPGGPWTAVGGLFSGTRLTAPPGIGNQGSVDVTVDLSALPWLRGRWDDAANPDSDANTVYDDEPVARATFGVYRDRMIFRREVTR
jgi:hypothetical protein